MTNIEFNENYRSASSNEMQPKKKIIIVFVISPIYVVGWWDFNQSTEAPPNEKEPSRSENLISPVTSTSFVHFYNQFPSN